MLSVFVVGAVASLLGVLAHSRITSRLPRLPPMPPRVRASQVLPAIWPQPPSQRIPRPRTPLVALAIPRTLSPVAAMRVVLPVMLAAAAPTANLLPIQKTLAVVRAAMVALADRVVMAGTAWPPRTPLTAVSAAWRSPLPRARL